MLFKVFSNPGGDDYILRGFNGRLVDTNPGKTTPTAMAIKYAQYMCCISLWFGGILGLTPEEFKGQDGSQSGRISSAFAASNADIPVELWGQHGDWASFKNQKKVHETGRRVSSFRLQSSYEYTYYFESTSRVNF